MDKKAFHNGKPTGLAGGAPRDAVKVEFGRRLQDMMTKHGLNQSETARRAELHMPNGKFGRDNVSGYVRGRVLPDPIRLKALAAVFDCDPDELLPAKGIPRVDERMPSLEMRDGGDGMAWVRINQALPWPVALQIAKLISEAEKAG